MATANPEKVVDGLNGQNYLAMVENVEDHRPALTTVIMFLLAIVFTIVGNGLVLIEASMLYIKRRMRQGWRAAIWSIFLDILMSGLHSIMVHIIITLLLFPADRESTLKWIANWK